MLKCIIFFCGWNQREHCVIREYRSTVLCAGSWWWSACLLILIWVGKMVGLIFAIGTDFCPIYPNNILKMSLSYVIIPECQNILKKCIIVTWRFFFSLKKSWSRGPNIIPFLVISTGEFSFSSISLMVVIINKAPILKSSVSETNFFFIFLVWIFHTFLLCLIVMCVYVCVKSFMEV